MESSEKHGRELVGESVFWPHAPNWLKKMRERGVFA